MRRLFKHYCLNEQIASKTARSVYLAHSMGAVSEKVVLKVFDAQCLPLDQENESVLQQVEWDQTVETSSYPSNPGSRGRAGATLCRECVSIQRLAASLPRSCVPKTVGSARSIGNYSD